MQFIVLGYDGDDGDALERRLAARDEHLTMAREMFDQGKWLYAAAILSEKGLEVTPLSAEQKERFRSLAQPAVRAWVEDQIGKEWPARLEAAVNEYRATH